MKKENTKFLKPRKDPIETEGKMVYCEGQRAWSFLRIKGEILSEFPQLRERREKLGYKLLFCRDINELENQFKKIKEIGVAPLLVWFMKV